MGKTVVMSLEDLKIEGDILDIGGDDFGVIYNVFREVEGELSLDYASTEDGRRLKGSRFDAATLFFAIGDLKRNKKKENLIKEIVGYLKYDGEIYIWDIVKNKGEFINNTVKVILPNNKIKNFTLKKMNPFLACSLEDVEKALEKYCKVVETKQWEQLFFIRAIKK